MSTGVEHSGGAAMPAALSALRDCAAQLADVAWWQSDDAILLNAVVELDRVQRQVDAARLAVLQRIDARGSYADAGAANAASWLRTATNAHYGKARAEVDLSVAISRYPHLNEALAAGTVSLAQVQVCVKAPGSRPAVGIVAERRCPMQGPT